MSITKLMPIRSSIRRPALALTVLAAVWSGGPARGDFQCALEGPTSARKTAVPSTGTLSALVIFTKFKGESSGADAAPSWATDLFSRSRPGSFAHFYDEMSRGQLRVDGQVLPRRYTSLRPASAYVAETDGALGGFAEFNLEILDQADLDVDMGRFDNDGADGVPNSGDDDGYVDIVFINLLTVPRGFFISGATGFASLGFDTDYICNDPAAAGGSIRIRGRSAGFGGTTQRAHVYPVAAAVMCHEFAHVLGLTDLFDQSSLTASGELDPEQGSAGIGKWGLMTSSGTGGWGVEDGPNAFCAWSLAELGWIGTDNENLVEVREDLRDAVLQDIDRGGKVYKIPLTADEYFLLENRQPSGSHYDRNIPAGGLLIWHVEERADNDEERHKRVDLVCADGLFQDRGFPGAQPDPVSGGDNLDFWSHDTAYAAAHNGNEGDATDPFDGVRWTRFAHDTNPRLAAYTGLTRNLPLGIAVDNIRAEGETMVVDILVRRPLDGCVSTDTTWSGEVVLDGDLVVSPGATLRLSAGTSVRFEPRRDSRASGFDPERSELLVFGALVLEGPVSFTSAAGRPRSRDWSGVYLLDGQPLALESVTIEHAAYGLVRARLAPGVTRWSGPQRLPRDLVVPADAELVVEAGASAGFASSDLSAGGRSPELVELVVEGQLTIEGSAGQAARFTLDSGGPDDLWYGIRMVPGAQVQADFLEVERCAYGFSGEVGPADLLRLADGVIQRTAGGGLRLRVNGAVDLSRTSVSGNTPWGIGAEGSGMLRLRDVVVEDNGWEGIYLGSCSLEATNTRILGNGELDPEDPRSGLLAVGGRGQKIELHACAVEGNALDGLELSGWEGEAQLHDGSISGNKRQGLRAAGLERLVLEGVRVERNLEIGASVGGAPVEICSSSFADNVGPGLVLDAGVSGQIDGSLFRNNDGLRLNRVDDLVVRQSVFENAAVGLLSESSRPILVGNTFSRNLTAIRVSGFTVPDSVSGNAFVGNPTAAENLSTRRLRAAGNYWGTADTLAIAAAIKGDVDWRPFLAEEPNPTAGGEPAAPVPERFALYPAFPNPFNARTTIPFDVAEAAHVELTVWDLLGRPVRRLAGSRVEPGSYTRVWDGLDRDRRPAATGVYIVHLRAGRHEQTSRLLLLR